MLSGMTLIEELKSLVTPDGSFEHTVPWKVLELREWFTVWSARRCRQVNTNR